MTKYSLCNYTHHRLREQGTVIGEFILCHVNCVYEKCYTNENDYCY